MGGFFCALFIEFFCIVVYKYCVHSPKIQAMKTLCYLLLIGTFVAVGCSGNSDDANSPTSNKSEVQTDSTNQEEAKEEKFISGLEITYQNFKSEKCFEADPEDEYSQDFCANNVVKQMIVKLTDQEVAKKINNRIFKAITDKPAGSISMKKWVNQVQQLESIYEASNYEVTCSQVEKGDDFLCMSVGSYSFSYGAAHGSSTAYYLTFDLKSGNEIKLKDLLSDGYKKALTRLGEKAFLKAWGNDGWEFTPGRGDFFLPDNFAITKKGLLFQYQQYEIGPYAAGMPEILIKYDQIKEFIPEGSLLNTFISAK
jgi:hypothetical protein